MSAVLSLQKNCIVYIVRSLLKVESQHLQDPCCEAVVLRGPIASPIALQLLNHLVEYYPGRVTDELLEVLVPQHPKTLNLTKCRFALQDATQYALLLPRLENVESLVLNEGLQAELLPDPLAEQWADGLPNLTSISLQDCPGLTDSFVSILLFGVPNIAHLDLARTAGITDGAFHNRSDAAPPSLASLDISGCIGLTNTAVRLLTELCGSSLRHLNVAGCFMNCLILWYLAGHSFYSCAQLASGVVEQDLSSHRDELLQKNQAARDCEGDANGNMSVNEGEEEEVGVDVGGGRDSDRNMKTGDVGARASDSVASVDVAVRGEDEGFVASMETREVGGQASDRGASAEATVEGGTCARAKSPPSVIEESSMKHRGEKGRNYCRDDGGTQLLVDSDSGGKFASMYLHPQPTMDRRENTEEGAVLADSEEQQSLIGGDRMHFDLSNDKQDTQNVDMVDDAEMSPDLGGARLKDKVGYGRPHNSTRAHSSERLFQPSLLSLNMSNIEFDRLLLRSCFYEFFSANQCLQSLTITKSGLSDSLLAVPADNCANLSYLSLEETIPWNFYSCNSFVAGFTTCKVTDSTLTSKEQQCRQITECSGISGEGLGYLLTRCRALKDLYIQGVPTNFQQIMESKTPLKAIHVAGTRIDDGILHQLPGVVGHTGKQQPSSLESKHLWSTQKLKELRLNSCEHITSEGILSMVENCPHLETFSAGRFFFTEDIIRNLAAHCPLMRRLDLCGAWDMRDFMDMDTVLMEIIPRFRLLQVLDIRWTLDYNSWKQCKSRIELKLQRLAEWRGMQSSSSDEEQEYEDLYVPLRSTSYAPLLQRLDLEECDQVYQKVLAEIVAVCCGSLKIIGCNGSRVEPKLLSL